MTASLKSTLDDGKVVADKRRTSRQGFAALALVALATVPARAPSAAAADGPILPAGSVRLVPAPSVVLRAPDDGRVNGDGFTATVTGYRFGRELSTPGSALRAPTGDELLVFGLTASSWGLTAALVVDGSAEALPRPTGPSTSSPVYYVASVPARQSLVALRVSKAGFAQEFSFSAGRRIGAQPSVLYTSPTGWEVTAPSSVGDARASVPSPLGGPAVAVSQQLVLSARLTYFLPGTGRTPAAPSGAWLVLTGSALGFSGLSSGQPALTYARPLRGSDITLTLPAGRPVTAHSGPLGPVAPGGPFAGYYYWRVPASTTSAVVHMTMPPLVASMQGAEASPGLRVKVSAAAVTLDLPSSNVPNTGPTSLPATTVPATHGTSQGVAVPSSRAAGPSSPTTGTSPAAARASAGRWLVVGSLLLVAILVVLVAWRKRRRRRSGTGDDQGAGAVTIAAVSGPPGAHKDGPRSSSAASAPELNGTGTGPASPGVTVGSDEVMALSEGGTFHMVGQVRLVRAVDPDVPAPSSASTTSFVSTPAPAPAGQRAPLRAAAAPEPGVERVGGAGLVPVPDAAPPLGEGTKELQILGSPRLVVGPGSVVTLGAPELELLARLAIEPKRTFTSEELRADIGTARETDWVPATLWTRISVLRKAIGPDHVPPASRAAGYQVVGIGSDVERFEAALARAKSDPSARDLHLAVALSLVREAPFAGVPVGSFGWALQAGGLATRVANSIYEAAVELARAAVAASDTTLAAWAISRARFVSRDDELLDELELDAASVSESPSALQRTWASTRRRYQSSAKELPTSLVQHYEDLQGRRQSSH